MCSIRFYRQYGSSHRSHPEWILISEVDDATVSWVAECLLIANPDEGRWKI